MRSPRRTDLPEWAAWLAEDADGTWRAYEASPNRHDKGYLRLDQDHHNPDWIHSLRQIDTT